MLFSKIITLSKSGEYSFSPSMRFTPHGRAASYCASVVSVSVAEVVSSLAVVSGKEVGSVTSSVEAATVSITSSVSVIASVSSAEVSSVGASVSMGTVSGSVFSSVCSGSVEAVGSVTSSPLASVGSVVS